MGYQLTADPIFSAYKFGVGYMRPVTEKHSGRCGHCKTAVPIDATVCTGCGAVWGLSNNLSREETYDAAIGAYRACKPNCVTAHD